MDASRYHLIVMGLLAASLATSSQAALAADGERESEVPTDPAPVEINGHDWSIPIGDAREAYRFGASVPAPVGQFWQREGYEWRVFWDAELETPQFVLPTASAPIAPPLTDDDPDSAHAEEAIRAFVDEHSEFFGVSSSALTEPYVYSVAQLRVFLFGQAVPHPSGGDGRIPVRGASLRVVLAPDGRLYWLNAHLVRAKDLEVLSGALVPATHVTSIEEAEGRSVTGAKLYLGFDPDAKPEFIWSLQVETSAESPCENIRAADDGALLARRRDVFFFEGDVSGSAHGAIPSAENLHTSPFAARLTEVPLDGCSIREFAGELIATTEPDGTFEGTIAEEHIDAEGRVRLLASLEHVVPERYGRDENGAIFSIRPEFREFGFEPNLPIEFDANQDGVPDAMLRQNPNEPFSFLVDPELIDSQEPEERALFRWSVQTYKHAADMLTFARRALEANLLERDPFLPFQCLTIRPQHLIAYQSYEPANTGCSTIQSSVVYNLDGRPNGLPRWNVVPTVFQHEFAHYLVANLSQRSQTRLGFRWLFEGICDALIAMTNRDCRVGYEATAGVGAPAAAPHAAAFCLDETTGLRDRDREIVGDLLWRLFQAFDEGPDAPGVNRAVSLTFLLLAARRSVDEERLTFFGIDALPEVLLLLDDLPHLGGDLDPTNGSPGADEIYTATIGKLFTDTPFIRGDSNQDGSVNIADAIATLTYLFGGDLPIPQCPNPLDVDNSGGISITDPIRLLNYLFGSGAPPHTPYPICGQDVERAGEEGNLGCWEFVCPM